MWETAGANCVHPDEPPPLSDIGKKIDKEVQKLNTVYENVTVDKYCIMPDHIHMIIFITPDECGRSWRAGAVSLEHWSGANNAEHRASEARHGAKTQFAPTLSRIIKQFKGSITKQIGFSFWQKSFNDRIIRNEKGYQEVWQYIDTNPLKWEEDCFLDE